MIPTKSEFIKEMEEHREKVNDEECEVVEEAMEYLQSFWNSEMNNEIITDYTSESMNDDELDFVKEKIKEGFGEFYDYLEIFFIKNWRRDVAKHMTVEQLKKYADKEQLEEIKRIEEIEVENAL